jgi:hypothetical protein
MKNVVLFFIALGAIIAVACNFIVESKFKDYGTTCQFENRGTTCGQCIAANCQSNVDKICVPKADGAEFGTVLGQVEQCARSFDTSGGNGCTPFLDAGAPEQGNSETALLTQLRHCVLTKCVVGSGAQPCRQCELVYTHPVSKEEFPLEKTECGRCIRETCKDLLVDCCGQYEAPMKKIAACGGPPTQAGPECAKAFEIPDAGSSDAAPTCKTTLPQCMQPCRGKCP